MRMFSWHVSGCLVSIDVGDGGEYNRELPPMDIKEAVDWSIQASFF